VACTPRQNSHISPLHLSHPPRRSSRCNAGKGTGGETAGPLSCHSTLCHHCNAHDHHHQSAAGPCAGNLGPTRRAPDWLVRRGGQTNRPSPYSNLLAPHRPTPLQSLGGRTVGLLCAATGRLVEEPTEAGAGELDGVAAVLSQAVLPLFTFEVSKEEEG
jgi:hypothetical protein